MKKTITAILILISATAFAQKEITIKYKEVSDTLKVTVVTYGKDGNLKFQSGKVIRKISVFENQNLKPEVTGAAYFTDKWEAIKPEDVYDVKPKN